MSSATSITVKLLAVLVLVAANGFFVATEFALVGDTLPLYRELGVAHPVWLLYFANTLLASNVALGPWIHTASAVQNLSLLHDGERLSARGRIAGLSERRGHQVVDLDVLLVADGTRPVMHVLHSAIYRLRSSEHLQ